MNPAFEAAAKQLVEMQNIDWESLDEQERFNWADIAASVVGTYNKWNRNKISSRTASLPDVSSAPLPDRLLRALGILVDTPDEETWERLLETVRQIRQDAYLFYILSKRWDDLFKELDRRIENVKSIGYVPAYNARGQGIAMCLLEIRELMAEIESGKVES